MQPIQHHFFAGMKGLNTAHQLKIALADEQCSCRGKAHPISENNQAAVWYAKHISCVWQSVLHGGGWRVREYPYVPAPSL